MSNFINDLEFITKNKWKNEKRQIKNTLWVSKYILCQITTKNHYLYFTAQSSSAQGRQ